MKIFFSTTILLLFTGAAAVAGVRDGPAGVCRRIGWRRCYLDGLCNLGQRRTGTTGAKAGTMTTTRS